MNSVAPRRRASAARPAAQVGGEGHGDVRRRRGSGPAGAAGRRAGRAPPARRRGARASRPVCARQRLAGEPARAARPRSRRTAPAASGRRRGLRQRAPPVQLAQLAHQHAHRPAVGDDVVQGDQQAGARPPAAQAQQRCNAAAGREPGRTAAPPPRAPAGAASRFARAAAAGRRGRPPAEPAAHRADHLHRPAVAAPRRWCAGPRGADDRGPGRRRAPASPARPRGARAGDVVGRAAGLELVEEPEPLLGEGGGQLGGAAARTGDRHQRRTGVPRRRRSAVSITAAWAARVGASKVRATPARRRRRRGCAWRAGRRAASGRRGRRSGRPGPMRSSRAGRDQIAASSSSVGVAGAGRSPPSRPRVGRPLAGRPRQGAAVDLAVGVERQRVQHGQPAGISAAGRRSASQARSDVRRGFAGRRGDHVGVEAGVAAGAARPAPRPRARPGARPARPRSRPARCGSRAP